jgi:hypothetical protein
MSNLLAATASVGEMAVPTHRDTLAMHGTLNVKFRNTFAPRNDKVTKRFRVFRNQEFRNLCGTINVRIEIYNQINAQFFYLFNNNVIS